MSELRLNTDGHIIKLGADNDVTLTHVHNTGLLLNSTMQLQFNDASQNINAPSATVLDINATDEIELNATAVDLNANLDVSGTTLLPTLGVITAKDLGVGIHVRTADSGASVANDADELVIENSGDAGLSILSGTGNYGTIRFGDSGDNDIAGIEYNHNGNLMKIIAGANAVCNITSAGFVFNEDSDDNDFRVESSTLTHALFISADGAIMSNETSANTNPGGLNLNQGAEDANIIALKSSDVAHYTTNEVEADSYFKAAKYSATVGGAILTGYGEGNIAMAVQGVSAGGQSSTTKSTSAEASVVIKGNVESSNSLAALPANHNALVIMNHTTTRFIFDTDGDFHADSSSTTFDAYDDAQLVRAYDLSHGNGVVDSKFDKFVAYNHEKLADLELVGREEDGTPNHFVNVTGMQRLHNGAIWQQYEKHNQLLEAVYELAEKAVGKKEADAILDKHEVKRLN